MGTTRSPDANDGGPPARKSTLFCPVCDHQSPPDGDWHVRDADAGVSYGCPECGETVTTRPATDEGEPGSGDRRSPGVVPGASLIAASVAAWRRVTTVWTAAVGDHTQRDPY
jgi:hypothetical protein